jgi:hypothetical protein
MTYICIVLQTFSAIQFYAATGYKIVASGRFTLQRKSREITPSSGERFFRRRRTSQKTLTFGQLGSAELALPENMSAPAKHFLIGVTHM